MQRAKGVSVSVEHTSATELQHEGTFRIQIVLTSVGKDNLASYMYRHLHNLMLLFTTLGEMIGGKQHELCSLQNSSQM